MRIAAGWALQKLVGGVVIVALSFLVTTGLVHKWLTPRNLKVNLIHILEATYGESCRRPVLSAAHAGLVRSGNATTLASLSCTNTNVVCPIIVDPIRIGNPASGCDKDFVVKWQCGSAPMVHVIYLPPDAADDIAWVSCLVQ